MIKLRKMRLAGNKACIGPRGMYVGFWWETRKKKKKKLLGRPKYRWEDNIKIDLRDRMECYGLI
jgi:hypothetical protein